MGDKKFKNLVMDTYRELYANCTVPTDFDFLCATSPRDETGRVKIPYEDYFIDGKTFDEIVDRNMKKHKMRKYDRGRFKMAIYLGCSPTTLQEKIERQNE